MKPLSLTARISLLFAVSASLVLLTTGYFLTQVVDAHFKEVARHCRWSSTRPFPGSLSRTASTAARSRS